MKQNDTFMFETNYLIIDYKLVFKNRMSHIELFFNFSPGSLKNLFF